MVARLQDEIRQTRPFASPEEEAFLNLQRTANLLSQALAAFLRPHGLTPAQYNVLRILRGARPLGLPCGEVGARLVTPVPDVTRLLDRLERRGLTERHRDPDDRRVVAVTATAAGLVLADRLDEPVAHWLAKRLGILPSADLTHLSESLQALRG